MLNQKDIDAPDFYVFPTPKWERILEMKNKFFPRLRRGEFIPNDQIVVVLRRMAQEQGKPVTIKEIKPRRWALWFAVLGAISIFGTGIILNLVK